MRRLTVFAFLTAFSLASPARADEKAEAKRQFDAGVSLLKAENYEGAAASFEASLELFPTKTALFNLANCYKTLQRYDEALAALTRLRRDFAGRLGAEMEEATIAIEKEIRNLVGTLNVEVDRPGATVVVDGREVGVSPLSKPVLLAPGSHEVTARRPGVEFASQKVRMLAGKELSVRLEGEGDRNKADEGASIPSISSIPSIESAPSPGLHPAWFWTGLGATAVFGGVTLGMNFAVREQKDELATDAELERAERMQSAGIAFLALTGAAAATTAVLAFFTDWGDETGADEGASIPSISSIPSIDSAPVVFAADGTAGVGITGRF
jgi:tetratricopeptide (TPR) repeat protein